MPKPPEPSTSTMVKVSAYQAALIALEHASADTRAKHETYRAAKDHEQACVNAVAEAQKALEFTLKEGS